MADTLEIQRRIQELMRSRLAPGEGEPASQIQQLLDSLPPAERAALERGMSGSSTLDDSGNLKSHRYTGSGLGADELRARYERQNAGEQLEDRVTGPANTETRRFEQLEGQLPSVRKRRGGPIVGPDVEKIRGKLPAGFPEGGRNPDGVGGAVDFDDSYSKADTAGELEQVSNAMGKRGQPVPMDDMTHPNLVGSSPEEVDYAIEDLEVNGGDADDDAAGDVMMAWANGSIPRTPENEDRIERLLAAYRAAYGKDYNTKGAQYREENY